MAVPFVPLQRIILLSCAIINASMLNLLVWNHVLASETIVIKSGILQESISVNELSEFTKTGKVPRNLKIYFDLAKQNPKIIRQILITPVSVNPIFLDKILNSVAGEIILDELSKVFHTRSRRADRKALRSALILSASDDRKITLIEIIENYPTPELELDGKHLKNAYNQLQKLQTGLENMLDIFI